jgi:Icc-related predicted phosphoesterase
VFGHIHEGYGYATNGNTHFINASVLDGRYQLNNKPLTVDWDKATNSITFINE